MNEKPRYGLLIFRMTLCFLFTITLSISFAQPTKDELLKRYLREQFAIPLQAGMSINPNAFVDQSGNGEINDELSLELVEALKDSAQIDNRPYYFYRIAKIYQKLNYPTLAQNYLKEAYNEIQSQYLDDSENLTILHGCSEICMAMGDFEHAIQWCDKMLALSPEDTGITYLRNYLQVQAYPNAPETKLLIDSSLERYPESTSIYFIKTMLLIGTETASKNRFGDGKFTGFKSDFSFLKQASEKYPNNIRLKMSVLWEQLVVKFIETVYYNSSVKSALFRNSESLSHQEKYRFYLLPGDSIQLTIWEREFLEMVPDLDGSDYSTAYLSLGVIKELQNDYRQAINYFLNALECVHQTSTDAPVNLSDYYDNIITGYLLLGDTVNAGKWTWRKIEDHASICPAADDYVDLSRYTFRNGQFDQCLAQLQHALLIDSLCYDAYVGIANIYMLKGDVDRASMYMGECYHRNPAFQNWFPSFVILNLMVNNNELAHQALKHMLRQNPNDVFARQVIQDFFPEDQFF